MTKGFQHCHWKAKNGSHRHRSRVNSSHLSHRNVPLFPSPQPPPPPLRPLLFLSWQQYNVILHFHWQSVLTLGQIIPFSAIASIFWSHYLIILSKSPFPLINLRLSSFCDPLLSCALARFVHSIPLSISLWTVFISSIYLFISKDDWITPAEIAVTQI